MPSLASKRVSRFVKTCSQQVSAEHFRGETREGRKDGERENYTDRQ